MGLVSLQEEEEARALPPSTQEDTARTQPSTSQKVGSHQNPTTRHLDWAPKIIATHLGWHPRSPHPLQSPLCLSGESPTSKPRLQQIDWADARC